MSSFRFMRRDSSRLRWRLPSTWTDRLDRDRTPSITGHEPAGVVTALGYGTTGPSVGQRVFSLDGARLRRAGVRRPRERRPGGPRRRRPGFRCHGGDIGKRSAGLIRAGVRVVSVVWPPETRPADGLAIDFVAPTARPALVDARSFAHAGSRLPSTTIAAKKSGTVQAASTSPAAPEERVLRAGIASQHHRRAERRPLGGRLVDEIEQRHRDEHG